MTQFHEQYSDEEAALVSAFGGHGSSCVIVCDACKRTYFNSGKDCGDYETGGLSTLLKNEQLEPDKYISQSRYCCIEAVMIGGEELIPQCVCGKAAKYISFLESHLHEIAKYCAERLASKAKDLKTELAKTELLMNALNESREEVEQYL